MTGAHTCSWVAGWVHVASPMTVTPSDSTHWQPCVVSSITCQRKRRGNQDACPWRMSTPCYHCTRVRLEQFWSQQTSTLWQWDTTRQTHRNLEAEDVFSMLLELRRRPAHMSPSVHRSTDHTCPPLQDLFDLERSPASWNTVFLTHLSLGCV